MYANPQELWDVTQQEAQQPGATQWYIKAVDYWDEQDPTGMFSAGDYLKEEPLPIKEFSFPPLLFVHWQYPLVRKRRKLLRMFAIHYTKYIIEFIIALSTYFHTKHDQLDMLKC